MSAVSLDSRDANDRISAIRDGDRVAFAEMVEPWLYRVYDVALAVLGSPTAAVDGAP